MDTNWVMQDANWIFVTSLVASLCTGVLITFIMDCSAGPHREPFWMAAMISAGSGATISTVVHVMREGSGLSIWQVMVIGAGCGTLGVLGYSLSVFRQKNSASAQRKPETKARAVYQDSREAWRLPRAGSRPPLSPPDFRKRKLAARSQEAAQQ